MYFSPEKLTELLKKHIIEGDHTLKSLAELLRREGYLSVDGRPYSLSNLQYAIKKHVPNWKDRPKKPRSRKEAYEEYERLIYPLPVECRYPAPTQEEQRVGCPFFDVCSLTNRLA